MGLCLLAPQSGFVSVQTAASTWPFSTDQVAFPLVRSPSANRVASYPFFFCWAINPTAHQPTAHVSLPRAHGPRDEELLLPPPVHHPAPYPVHTF